MEIDPSFDAVSLDGMHMIWCRHIYGRFWHIGCVCADVDAAFKRAVFGGPCTLLRWVLAFYQYVFDTMSDFRYGEEVTLKGVTFAASPAGHSIGGSVWQLTKGAEV